MASAKGATLVICEPMWTLTPRGSDVIVLGERGAIKFAGSVDGHAELVLAKSGGNVRMRFRLTSGLTRKATRASLRNLAARAASTASSDSLSRLNIRMPALQSGVHLLGSFANARKDDAGVRRLRSARRTRSSSPPETTSNPEPNFANMFRTDRLELAFTE